MDNSHLLAFEDIQDIFSKMMLVKYEPMAKLVNSQEPLNVEITKAGLYYVLIQQQNDASNTLLVPVWAFYGYRSWDWIEEQGIKYGLYEQPILMINAIDGRCRLPAHAGEQHCCRQRAELYKCGCQMHDWRVDHS